MKLYQDILERSTKYWKETLEKRRQQKVEHND